MSLRRTQIPDALSSVSEEAGFDKCLLSCTNVLKKITLARVKEEASASKWASLGLPFALNSV